MDASVRGKSFVLTILVHGAILLLLFFFILRIPIPPFGGGGGGNASLGFVEIAMGDDPPQSLNQETEALPVNSEAVTDEDALVTQETEEAPFVKTNPEIKKKKKNEKASEPLKTEKPKPISLPERKADPFALYKGKTKGGSQGTSPTGAGDEGTRSGDPNSIYNGKGGSGSGTGDGVGSGSGSGTGSGNGNGAGNGNGGFSYSLGNRKCIGKPVISDRSQETGTVVVEITVDKHGKTVKATPGARGTTTSSSHLWNLARQAAFTAKFNASPESAEEQKGTLTFVFSLE